MSTRHLFTGALTFVPGAKHFLHRATGGTSSARYCYSVWLRHLTLAKEAGLWRFPTPRIAELGPGDSIGTGLAALISGGEAYYGLDVVPYANTARNLEIFDELVELFRMRVDIPGPEEFPNVNPKLDTYEFPSHILTEAHLTACLSPERLALIRRSIASPGQTASLIHYASPWFDEHVIEQNSLDMIFSHTVLQCVEDLPATYRIMAKWLKPGGWISNQIDFKNYGLSDEWNGHWSYSDAVWILVKGRRTYSHNRAPYTAHVQLMKEAGFEIALERKISSPSKMSRTDLADRFKHLTDTDLMTSGVFFQAVKPIAKA